MSLLLITEDEKKHYVLIKDFDKLMYNQSKHKERKHFCVYCLQCFSSESILAKHTSNCLTINDKQAHPVYCVFSTWGGGGGCSVHRGVFSTLGDIMSTLGGYHEYIRGCSVHWGCSVH